MSSETQKIPEFRPNIPSHLLHGKTKSECWIYEQLSVQGQQNHWLIERAVKTDERHKAADKRMEDIESRLIPFEKKWVVLTAKWSIIALLFSALVIPIGLAVFGAWVSSLFSKP